MRELKVVDAGTVPYEIAYEWQASLRDRRIKGEVPDVLLMLEHPHVYSLGRRFSREHLLLSDDELDRRGIQVTESDRGGSITYHGPGQLVGYPILDLRKMNPDGNPIVTDQPDVIVYLRRLEESIIRSLRALDVVASRRDGFTGVWVGESKVAAVGVNVTRGVTKHGFAINVTTDLTYFDGMIPCGIPDGNPASLEQILRRRVGMDLMKRLVSAHLARIFHRRPVEGSLVDLELELPGSATHGDVIPMRGKEQAAG